MPAGPSERTATGSDCLDSGDRPDDAIVRNLRAALERAEDPGTRFHIRETLQLLEIE